MTAPLLDARMIIAVQNTILMIKCIDLHPEWYPPHLRGWYVVQLADLRLAGGLSG